jgi:voltage-gated sodium channel
MNTQSLTRFFTSKEYEFAITAVILFNALVLALETFPAIAGSYGRQIEWLNNLILFIFAVEIGLKILCFGREFWRQGWNWFDLSVVLIAALPASQAFSALRVLRAVRLLRLVAVVPSLRRVVDGFLQAIPSLGSVVILLLLLLYVFSIMGTKMFGTSHPELFGTLGESAFSLFTVMTLEGWPDLAREVMTAHPWAWLFFIVFIMLSSWTILNLFIGVIVDSMQAHTHEREEAMEMQGLRNQQLMMAELTEIRRELSALKSRLETAPRASEPGDLS